MRLQKRILNRLEYNLCGLFVYIIARKRQKSKSADFLLTSFLKLRETAFSLPRRAFLLVLFRCNNKRTNREIVPKNFDYLRLKLSVKQLNYC